MTDVPRILTAAEHAAIWRAEYEVLLKEAKKYARYTTQAGAYRDAIALAHHASRMAIAYEAAAKEEKTP